MEEGEDLLPLGVVADHLLVAAAVHPLVEAVGEHLRPSEVVVAHPSEAAVGVHLP